MKNLWYEITITEITLCHTTVEYFIGTMEEAQNYCRWIEENPCFLADITETIPTEN